jgi:hypothetical protein
MTYQFGASRARSHVTPESVEKTTNQSQRSRELRHSLHSHDVSEVRLREAVRAIRTVVVAVKK